MIKRLESMAVPTNIRVTGVVLFVLLAAGSAAAQPAGPAEDMVAIGARIRDFVRIWDAGDVADMLDAVTDDVQAYDIAFSATGRDELARAVSDLPSRLDGVRVIQSPTITWSGNLAFAVFTTEGRRDSPAGGMQVWNRWSMVIRKVDSAWRVAHYHLSGDPGRPRAF